MAASVLKVLAMSSIENVCTLVKGITIRVIAAKICFQKLTGPERIPVTLCVFQSLFQISLHGVQSFSVIVAITQIYILKNEGLAMTDIDDHAYKMKDTITAYSYSKL